MEIILTGAHTLTRPNSRSLIQTFPSEILLIIFKFTYVAARRHALQKDSPCYKTACLLEKKCYCDMERSEECDTYDDHRTPSTLFPNSVASVCSRWGELMLLVPVFWTRIVILLDSDSFSLSGLQRQLHLSGNRPLDIIVARNLFSDEQRLMDLEKIRMAQIITALRPHFHRCRTLKIDVIYSSSFPRLLAVLPSNMPHLHTLSLESCIDNGRPGIEPYCFLDRTSPFLWANLTTVMIDGWNLSDLHDRNPTPENYILPRCKSLSIIFGEIPGTVMRRIFEACHFHVLKVDSVNISPDINLITITNPIHSRSHTVVTIKNLDRESTKMILPYVCASPLHLTINNCPLPSLPLFSHSEQLSLHNIGLDQGLGDFIRSWNGTVLEIFNCPGLNDDVLGILGDNNNREYHWSYYFTIADCHNFSVAALKELVKRKANFRSNSSMLIGMYIIGTGRSLSEEDVRWFEEELDPFGWEAS